MKNLKVRKGNIKSFGVKCPQDWETNTKWREIIEGFNFICTYDYKGNSIGYFYGIKSDGDCDCFENYENFKAILTIDEAHAYLFGEESPHPLPSGMLETSKEGFLASVKQSVQQESVPRVSELRAIYVQKDGGDQKLEISTCDTGDGMFFTIKTRKWSFDSVGEFIDILQDFKQKLNLKENV